MKYIICFILIVLNLLASATISNCSDQSDEKLQELSISAVKNKYPYVGKYILISNRIRQSYFSKTPVYYVGMTNGPEPSPVYIVLFINAEKALIFGEYNDVRLMEKVETGNSDNWNRYEFIGKQVEQFSEIIANENYSISEQYLRKYAKAFLFLVSPHSELICDYEDIGNLPEYKTKELSPYREEIKHIQSTYEDGVFKLVFFSWDCRGVLMRWKLDVKKNGEVVNHKTEILGTDRYIF